jgi:hypothetical protein
MSITTESLDNGLNENSLAVGVGETGGGGSVAVAAGGNVGIELGAAGTVDAGGAVAAALGTSVGVDAGGAVGGTAQEDKRITKSANHTETVFIVFLLFNSNSNRYFAILDRGASFAQKLFN